MKRIIFLISALAILNGCGQTTSLLGPSYTLAKSGSIVQAGNSIAASYGVKKTFNQTAMQSYGNSLTDISVRECETIHSSELNKIFFDTLDEIDCYKDPFSILR
tara:strand:- start:101 stop:412 length:312 start_codon:yes stop_codon:yes gene_type:complete